MGPQARFREVVTIDLHSFKEILRKKLPPDNAVLVDLLGEPDFMPVGMAEVLVPHYLQRLERDLEKYKETGHPVLASD